MGKLTQYFDYLNRPSEDISADFIKSNYTHIEITGGLKQLKKDLQWHKYDEIRQETLPFH